MKKILLIIMISAICTTLSAQMVAIMEVKKDIEGICDKSKVYALLPMLDKKQVEAICPISKEEILKRLNAEVKFLKENPKFKGKGMVNIIINCEGKVIQCEIDNKTGDDVLDAQVVSVFNSLGEWKNGTLNGKPVDSTQLFSFKIKKGVISFD